MRPAKTQISWASAKSDQSLSLGPQLPIERTAKTLIRLGRCPDWSESSLGAHSLCWFCHFAAQMGIKGVTWKTYILWYGYYFVDWVILGVKESNEVKYNRMEEEKRKRRQLMNQSKFTLVIRKSRQACKGWSINTVNHFISRFFYGRLIHGNLNSRWMMFSYVNYIYAHISRE